jgi:hypothetical protein
MSRPGGPLSNLKKEEGKEIFHKKALQWLTLASGNQEKKDVICGLKGPSGQISLAWEWWHCKGLC